jgi:hypothetical protein
MDNFDWLSIYHIHRHKNVSHTPTSILRKTLTGLVSKQPLIPGQRETVQRVIVINQEYA